MYGQVSTLLPNDLHNLENPSLYLEEIRKNSDIKVENLQDIFYNTEANNIMRNLVKKLEEDD